jgi:hypothetical protein
MLICKGPGDTPDGPEYVILGLLPENIRAIDKGRPVARSLEPIGLPHIFLWIAKERQYPEPVCRKPGMILWKFKLTDRMLRRITQLAVHVKQPALGGGNHPIFLCYVPDKDVFLAELKRQGLADPDAIIEEQPGRLNPERN